MVSKFHGNGNAFDTMEVGWVGRNTRHFISTDFTTEPGRDQVRLRWRCVDNVSAHEHISVSVPDVVEQYHSCTSMIDLFCGKDKPPQRRMAPM